MARPTVLVVDDEERVHEVVSRHLDPVARRLRALSLGQARAALAAEPVDVLLLDLNLPDGNGAWLLREQAPAIAAGAIEVLILSGYLDPSRADECAEAGALACLDKSAENYQA